MTDVHAVRVPAIGPEDADIAFVGETPGRQEAYNGEPFYPKAKAGGTFKSWIEAAGLRRQNVWITNVLKRLPKNKKQVLWDNQDAKEPSDEMAQGMMELREELSRVDPNVVCTMGNVALWALTGKWGIMKWRGSILESELVPGLKVVPTIHPAWFHRAYQWQWESLAYWDIERVVEESKSPELQLPDRNYIINPSQGQIDEAVERILSGSVVTYDTEWWSPDDLACIGFTNSPEWAICIPTWHPGAVGAYETILQSDLLKVAQNSMFDVVYLRDIGMDVKAHVPVEGSLLDADERVRAILEDNGRVHDDIMVSHHVTWPDLRNSLDWQTSIYTREQYYKEDRKVWQDSDEDLEERRRVMYTYNCKDVCVTHEIWEKHHKEYPRNRGGTPELESKGTERAYQLQMCTFDLMARSTVKGIRCDHGRLAELHEENKQEAAELKQALWEAVGWKPNPRSYKDVHKLVYDQLGIRERKKKPTAQATLMDIAAQEDDNTKRVILQTIIHIRKALNANSKYINDSIYDKRDGRIRCSWNMAGTKNGRLSASKDKFRDTGASLQTIPKQAREIFIPDPGMVFVKPDLEQAEARIVAYLADDYRTLSWLDEGLDIHKKLAELLFGIPYEDVEKGTKHRYLAKTCRHALNYQMGPRTFKLTINEDFHETGFGVTASQAKDLREDYLTIHSALKQWWSDVKQELSSNGYLENPLGRRRRFLGKWGGRLFRDAIAFVPQSTIGDLTHMGLVAIDRELPYAEVLINIHDGSLIQIPEDRVSEALPVMKQCLDIPLTVNGYDVTIPTEFEVGYNWKDTEVVEVES